jgi:hypothetical protein
MWYSIAQIKQRAGAFDAKGPFTRHLFIFADQDFLQDTHFILVYAPHIRFKLTPLNYPALG